MKPNNHFHDIKITTPWTVFSFVSYLIISFSAWLTFFVFIPIAFVLDLNKYPSENLFQGNEWSVFFKWLLLIIVLLVLFFRIYYVLFVDMLFSAADELKLLLSCKIIRLESHQITFIPAIRFFQKKPIKIPKNLIQLSLKQQHIKYKPTWLVEFRFIVQDVKPLIFFKLKDITLAKKIGQEIADFYQIKRTEKFKTIGGNNS